MTTTNEQGQFTAAPEWGTEFFYVDAETGRVSRSVWYAIGHQTDRLRAGNCYRTERDAAVNAYSIWLQEVERLLGGPVDSPGHAREAFCQGATAPPVRWTRRLCPALRRAGRMNRRGGPSTTAAQIQEDTT